MAVIAEARPGCAPLGSRRASAGYNGRGAEANAAGVEAELRNEAAAMGGDAVVIRDRVVGAPAIEALGGSPGEARGAVTSGGCPNCIALRAEIYRCGRAAAAPPAAPASAAADAALGAAAESARRCLPPGSPGGEARVRVTFAPTGDVVYAEVEGEGFAGTALGSCVAGKIRNAHVPPFPGAPRSLERTWKITP